MYKKGIAELQKGIAVDIKGQGQCHRDQTWFYMR